MSPSRSRSRSDALESADCSASCMRSDAVCRERFRILVMPVPTIRDVCARRLILYKIFYEIRIFLILISISRLIYSNSQRKRVSCRHYITQ